MRVWEQREQEQPNLSSAVTWGWTSLESPRLAGGGDGDVTVPPQLLPSFGSRHTQQFQLFSFPWLSLHDATPRRGLA